MKITLLGAAGDVTGSAYLVTTDRARVLVDFGLFQGSADLDAMNVLPPQIDAYTLDAVLVTHGHLDHTGRLPLLAKAGYAGPIFATPATVEMTTLILNDAANIQVTDTERANRRRAEAGKEPLAPLYDQIDVDDILVLMQPLDYAAPNVVAPGITARIFDSGHMLGSVSMQLEVEDAGARKTVLFSGDIGPAGMPWLRDAETAPFADLIFLESTYGDRDHRSLSATLDEGEAIVREAAARRSKILVPAFAIGRSQQILYHMAGLFRQGLVDPFPVYLDSPMAIRATRIYAQHPELFDQEATALLRSGRLQQDLETVRVAESVEQSKLINEADGPCMVVASSGMCTGGRILHHLRHNLDRPDTAVLIVGYQAAGTLGRQLVDGADRVRIHGHDIDVNATIHTLGGFSAHAGRRELLNWLEPLAATGPRVVLTHGEDRGRNALAREIRRRYGLSPTLPLLNDVVEL
ncbi:MAG: MBL fold metallo-hydrolase [Caldilineaceae bacterium]|nr:MBL fold metallo-hydrolase [Caldilineaceae bacterium]